MKKTILFIILACTSYSMYAASIRCKKYACECLSLSTQKEIAAFVELCAQCNNGSGCRASLCDYHAAAASAAVHHALMNAPCDATEEELEHIAATTRAKKLLALPEQHATSLPRGLPSIPFEIPQHTADDRVSLRRQVAAARIF